MTIARFLSPAFIAADLGVCVSTAVRYIKKMRHVRLSGKRYRVRQTDYEAWLKRRTECQDFSNEEESGLSNSKTETESGPKGPPTQKTRPRPRKLPRELSEKLTMTQPRQRSPRSASATSPAEKLVGEAKGPTDSTGAKWGT